jgi:hypothetical protein
MGTCIAALAICASCGREIRVRADLRTPFGPAGVALCARCDTDLAEAYREYEEEKRAELEELARREADFLTPVELLLLHAPAVA